ncbi:MAG: hypothetical protein AB1832_01035 [Pseudomonadota bacterium]
MADSTPHQRLYIRCMLHDLGMSTLHVDEHHIAVAEACSISGFTEGQRLDEALTRLTVEQAREYSRQLALTAAMP